MPITDPIFLSTYQGPSIQRDGVQYVWVNGKYEVSSQIPPNTAPALLITKKLTLRFNGIIDPDTVLSGADIKVFVDGNEWTGNYRIENQSSVDIILDEPYIRTQRLITFVTANGTPKVRYVVKSKVFAENDVIVSKIGIAEEIPILGTSKVAVVVNPDPIITPEYREPIDETQPIIEPDIVPTRVTTNDVYFPVEPVATQPVIVTNDFVANDVGGGGASPIRIPLTIINNDLQNLYPDVVEGSINDYTNNIQ